MEIAVKVWKAWNADDDARLRGLVAEHLTYAEIGAILGRNKNSCIGRAHRLGIKSSETKPPRPQKVKRTPVDAIFPARKPATPIEPVIAQDNKPQPRFEQPEASTTAFGVPRGLLYLQPHHCRWPVSGERADTLFCCAQRESLTGPYCTEHRLIAWRPTTRQLTTKAYR